VRQSRREKMSKPVFLFFWRKIDLPRSIRLKRSRVTLQLVSLVGERQRVLY